VGEETTKAWCFTTGGSGWRGCNSEDSAFSTLWGAVDAPARPSIPRRARSLERVGHFSERSVA
jgi:hypothetical protein